MKKPSPEISKEEIDLFSGLIANTSITKTISHFDALSLICEKRNIEPEVAATLLNSVIKEKIRREAEELHILKAKKKRLPI